MTSFWKIAAPATCVAVICGAAILWPVYKKKAIERKFIEVAKVCRVRAFQGDAKAQFKLAFMYSQGRGVPQDYTEAIRWYRKAAEQGDAKAQYNLAFMYSQGTGVPQDYVEASRWSRKAAEHGDAKAQCYLGSSYSQGKGVPQDYSEAIRWYRLAADQGYAMAQYGLGNLYRGGRGVSQNYAEAVYWYRKAANHGDANAQYGLGFMYQEGQGVPQDCAEAVRWYRKAAEQGDANAQIALRSLKAGSNTIRKIRYVAFSLAFLVGLWLSVDFLFPGTSLRDWRQKAQTLAGILGMSWAVLSLYEIDHVNVRYSACGNAFSSAKGMLGGMFTAAVICLFLAGWSKRTGGKKSGVTRSV